MPGKLGAYYSSFRASAATMLVVAALLLGGGAAWAQGAASAKAPATKADVGTASAAEKKEHPHPLRQRAEMIATPKPWRF
jgi:hypothetical protein